MCKVRKDLIFSFLFMCYNYIEVIDMINIFFLLSQLAALIAWIFFAYSYHAKRENRIIYLQLVSSIFYCVSYLFVGAITGFLISAFEALKEYGCYKTDKDKYIFIITIPIYIVIALISEHSMYTIIPILASLIDGYGMLRNNKIMVFCGIVSNFMWIYYDLYYLEYVTALGDLLLVLSNLSIVIFWIIKYISLKNIRITSDTKLTDKTLEEIKKLDDECYDYEYRWPFEKLKELYLKENDSYILIKDKSRIIGYVNILNLDNDLCDTIISSDYMLDNYNEDNIRKYDKSDSLFLNINSIVIKREYNNKKLVSRLEKNINNYIDKKIRDGYKIDKIFIYVVNELENQIVTDLGFVKVKDINNECLLYVKKYA